MKKLPLFFFALLFSPSALLAAEKIRVATFSTILTEIAQKVGGDRIEVVALMKPGTNPHDYEPKPDDLKQVGRAHLVLLSARPMENYLNKLKEAAGAKGHLVEIGDIFSSQKNDPHWWHSIDNMKRATARLCEELTKIDPDGEAQFTANADAYTKQLDALQKWARAEIAKLPRDKRKLVTAHDAFEFFARDFGFTVYPISGLSPEDEPSSKKVAEIIAMIKKNNVKAVFFENLENPKVLHEITRETGAKIGGELFADALGEGEAATYEGMFRHNVTTIIEALK